MSTVCGDITLLLTLLWLLSIPNSGSVLYTALKTPKSFSNAGPDILVIASMSELVPFERRYALGEAELPNKPVLAIFVALFLSFLFFEQVKC